MSLIHSFVNRFYLKLSRSAKRWIFRVIDLFLFGISIYLAFLFRYDFFEAHQLLPKFKNQLYLLLSIKLFFFWIVGVYRPVLRYTGLEFLVTSLVASLGSTGLVALSIFLLRLAPLPRSILVLDSLSTLFLMVGVRLGIRWLLYKAVTQAESDNQREKVIIYGAGEAGSQLAQALSGENRYKVVGFVDDNIQLHHQIIHGVKIYPPKNLSDLVKKLEIDSILLAMASAGKQKNREVINGLQHLEIEIKTIPGAAEIISGKVAISEIRNIDIVDLLGREEVKPDLNLLEKNIRGKAVMVTGAGGSIGSELCRQILRLHPLRLVLFERNEFALYNIDIELRENFPEVEIIPHLGSITIQDLVERVLNNYRIETIYHAAAYKHVPLIEQNIVEGVYNNIKGTLSCAQAAARCDVETLVLISTDKAVRPTNVMGATKRVSELILQAYAKKSGHKTKFVMVRFGNVLDSAGSVVPRFRKQLAEGKNLTITHKDIKRYFMSIPEASRLVIQAGALSVGGEVFLLEMGEPVRIYDLAVQMINLSGLTLGKDIDLEITGLRPGEKLFEELLIDCEKNEPTIHPKIFSAKEHFIPWEELESNLERLFKVTESANKEEILQELKKLVPEFSHNQHLN